MTERSERLLKGARHHDGVLDVVWLQETQDKADALDIIFERAQTDMLTVLPKRGAMKTQAKQTLEAARLWARAAIAVADRDKQELRRLREEAREEAGQGDQGDEALSGPA